MTVDDEVARAVATLRDPATIRGRCARVLERGIAGGLDHFAIDLARLPVVVDEVVATTRAAYPDLAIPEHSRWGHFGSERLRELESRLAAVERDEAVRARIDLVVTSVLLDAGAGDAWRYREGERELARSEGLAVASLRMFEAGAFAGDGRSLRADADGLRAIDGARLGAGFQVAGTNPLVGLEGRAALLRALGETIASSPAWFGEAARPGHLFDRLRAEARGGRLPAARVLAAVLEGLGAIWPDRIALGGVNMGDVWPHPAAGGEGASAGMVPLHKLSQWLTYSLLDPLRRGGIEIVELGALTGLAEYRNGGLFVDLGVLVPKRAEILARAFAPGDPVIVEWRALTVALLDRTAELVRARLGLDAERLPLARVLEGGTWATGRRIARALRPGGGSPIALESDGTVF